MANQLGVQEVQVQSTLTFLLISYGLSQLVTGSILDSFGRYRIGLFSMVTFSIASFIIASSVDINVILLVRVIQGISAATIIVAKRGYFVDVYSGNKLNHLKSLFTIIWSMGPIAAPFVGGYLETFFGWQSNFVLLGGLVLICAFFDWIFGSESTPEFPVYIMVSFFSYTMVNFFPPKNMTNLSLSYLTLTVLSVIIVVNTYRQNRKEH